MCRYVYVCMHVCKVMRRSHDLSVVLLCEVSCDNLPSNVFILRESFWWVSLVTCMCMYMLTCMYMYTHTYLQLVVHLQTC